MHKKRDHTLQCMISFYNLGDSILGKQGGWQLRPFCGNEEMSLSKSVAAGLWKV